MVDSACDELTGSVRFRKILGIILTIGNRLNTAGPNQKGIAGAITLDSLLKLDQVKAFDKKTTFLHYLALVIQRNNETLIHFKDELPSVFKAERIFWDQNIAELEKLENQLDSVRRVALHQARIACSVASTRSDGSESVSVASSTPSVTLEEEVEVLRSTPVGMFTLDAIMKVSSLIDAVEETKKKFTRLLEYFGEDEREYMQPHEVFKIVVTFCRNFDAAREAVEINERARVSNEHLHIWCVTSLWKPTLHSCMFE